MPAVNFITSERGGKPSFQRNATRGSRELKTQGISSRVWKNLADNFLTNNRVWDISNYKFIARTVSVVVILAVAAGAFYGVWAYFGLAASALTYAAVTGGTVLCLEILTLASCSKGQAREFQKDRSGSSNQRPSIDQWSDRVSQAETQQSERNHQIEQLEEQLKKGITDNLEQQQFVLKVEELSKQVREAYISIPSLQHEIVYCFKDDKEGEKSIDLFTERFQSLGNINYAQSQRLAKIREKLKK